MYETLCITNSFTYILEGICKTSVYQTDNTIVLVTKPVTDRRLSCEGDDEDTTTNGNN